MKTNWIPRLASLGILAATACTVLAQSAAPKRGQPIKPLAAPSTNATSASATSTNGEAAPATPKLPTGPLEKDGEYSIVGFDRLSGFVYEIPDETKGPEAKPATPAKDQIPKEIRSLNTMKVALKGFMLPLKVEGGLITELLIMRDQSMCCYGAVPKINEWVSVRMTGKGVKPVMDQAVTIYGTLKVGEVRENGYLVGIYELN
ncbi:MAG TPA: hypothetical protein VK968_05075, partial [Roseimicrobium sp.]|nr:hypothetical protein [Roseimicrobium sp.]